MAFNFLKTGIFFPLAVFLKKMMGCPLPNQVFVPPPPNSTLPGFCVCAPGWGGAACNIDFVYISSAGFEAFSGFVLALCAIGAFFSLYEVFLVLLRKDIKQLNHPTMFFFSRCCAFGLFFGNFFFFPNESDS